MKPYPKYPKYLITEDGQVINSETGKTCKQRVTVYGYLTVCLGKGTYRTHRLVAETYLPNPENKREVNHIDCNKQNNHVLNLEWVSSKENKAHAWQHGLYSDIAEDHHAAQWTNTEIHEVCKMLQDGVSNKVIAERFGMHKDHVAHIKCGDIWASISKDYDFKLKIKPRWGDALLHKVCEMLQDGKHYKVVAEELGLPDRSVNRIQNRKLHTRISDKYVW